MNQSNHFFHWLACVVFAVSLSLSSDAEDRVALIIGIDDYQSEEIPDLEGAIRDARLMSDSLKQISPSFEVQLLENPSLDDVFDATEQFGVSARRAQCALFYFAGHGIEFHGENFLLTGDSSITDNIETGVEATKRRLRRKMLSLNVVMDEIELTQADLKLLVLDACRNNPIEINEGGKTRSLGGTRGLARVSAPLGMLVSYSADAGQVANDGLFTEVLAKNLTEPKLSVMEVFAKTRDEVSAISKKRKEEDSRYNLQLPAEYNKLGWAGIKFVFNPETTPTPPGPTNPSTPSTPPSMPRNPNTPRENTGTAPPSSDFDNSMGMRMVSIPGGSFNMGDLGGDGDQSETPVRQVELSPFHIGATEVTQDQWASLMGESISDLRREAGFSGESPFGSGPNHPVYYVSWEAAVEFCNRLTERERTRSGLSKSFIYRLPTEAEWEFACRAGWEEPFGGDPFEMGKIAGFGGADPVGQFNANDFRLHDMHGNVWEWCQDYYRPNYAGLSTRDPVGPTSGDTRVFRGGSWLDGIRAARSSSRGFALPTLRHRTVGFRVVLGTRP